MKKLCLPLLLIMCLLLGACGGREFSDAHEQLTQRLGAAEALSFTANVRAEYENKTARFTLSYSEDSQGGSVTVLAPQLIAGVTARVKPDGASLEYDGISLGTGELDDYGLSPMSALPLLVQALKTGALDSGWTEGDYTVMQIDSTDTLSCTVWFRPDGLEPCQAELISDGRVKVFIEISDWQEGAQVPAPTLEEHTGEIMEY